MQSLTALLLVPFMALLIGIQESSGANTAPKKLYSEEAGNTIKELQKYLNNLDQEFYEFSNQLKQDNNVLETLQGYRQLYESSKNTECKVNELPFEDDEQLLDSFINDCTDSIPVNKISAFHSKITLAKAKVKAIDETLQENAQTCDSNSTSCEENKEKALADLSSVLSAKAKAKFENDAHQVLAHAKKHVEECFTEECDYLLKEVQAATNAVTTCLATLSK